MALTNGRESLSYGGLEGCIRKTARRLSSEGITRGGSVAVIAQNSIEYAVLIFAAYRVGVTLVPLNTRWDESSWRDCIRKSRPSAMIVDGDRTAFAKSAGVRYLLLDSETMDSDYDEESPSHPDLSYEVWTEHNASIMFTSGSSGSPKGVILTLGNHISNAAASNENIRLAETNCWLASLPFYHVGGMSILYRTAMAGCSAYVSSRFVPGEVNGLIDDGQITHISLVPNMLQTLLDARTVSKFPDTIKAILLGGSPVPEKLIHTIKSRNLPVLTTYGLTEAASQVCTLPPESPPDTLASCGPPLGGAEVQIVSEDESEAETGVVGEIRIRGNKVFRGYLAHDEIDVFDDNGYFQTRDIGYFDESGYLHVVGRKDDMFISGGENIHPAQIENVAMEFPGVVECAVIGVEDEEWGARPVLFVNHTESEFSLECLKVHLERRLSRMHFPDAIIELDHIPRTSLDKIDKRRLHEIWTERGGS